MLADFIANSIMASKKDSIENGQEKYRAYFIKTGIYTKHEQPVCDILMENDCADCIVKK